MGFHSNEIDVLEWYANRFGRFVSEIRMTHPSPYHWTQYSEREKYARSARAKFQEIAARHRRGR